MIRFMYDNEADKAIITASTTNTNYPASNIQNEFKSVVWKSTTSADTLVFDSPASIPVNCVIILNHNFEGGGTYKFQGNPTDSWGSPSLDETLDFNTGPVVKFFTQTGGNQYHRITATNVLNTEVSIGRVFFGLYFQPSREFLEGFGNSSEDLSMLTQNLNGQVFSDTRAVIDNLALSFYTNETVGTGYGFKYGTSYGRGSERYEYKRMYDLNKSGKGLFITQYPTNSPNNTIYGRFATGFNIVHRIKGLYQVSFGFKENA